MDRISCGNCYDKLEGYCNSLSTIMPHSRVGSLCGIAVYIDKYKGLVKPKYVKRGEIQTC